MSGNQDFVIKKGVLKKYKGPGGDITIPEGVAEIESRVFENCTGLTSVTIPEGVTEIGGSAFFGCANLTSVTIPEGVTEIGAWAFQGCTGLTSVTIPAGVTEIGSRAFSGCSGLTSVTIPEGVTEIGFKAFSGCSNLTSVTIPEGVTEIGDSAFDGCANLTSVTIPEGVKKIGWNTFDGCSNLTSVTIPEGVTEIGFKAFSGCSNLTSVTIPEGVTEIGGRAFEGCTSLTSVTIPEGVKIIGEYAFFDCKKLEPPRELLRGEKKLPVGLTETIRELWRGELQPKDWAGLYLFQEAKAWTELFQKYMPNSQTEEIAQAMAELLAGSKKAKCFAKAAEYAQKHPGRVRPEVLRFFMDGAKPTKAAETAKAEKARKTAETAQKAAEKEARPFENTPIADLWKLYRESDLMASYRKKGGKESPLKKVLLNPSLKLDKPQKTAPPFVVLCAVVPYMDQYSYHQAISGYKRGDYSNYQTIEAADKAAAALDPASFQEFLTKNLPVSVYGGPHTSWMLPCCRFGDGKTVQALISKQRDWASWDRAGASGRDKIITLRGALFLSDTREAMLELDKTKNWEGETLLTRYAQLRGIGTETLWDTVLADFGLDKDGKKVYDLEGNTVTVSLAQDLTLSIFDGNAGKAVKSIPKKGAAPQKYEAAKADFAEMKKNAKKVAKARCDRLFQDFLSGAEYPAEKWQVSYLGENPLLRQVASLLVWSQDGQTFTLRDGAVIDSGEQPYAISGRPIQVAHPMEMKPGDVLAWQKYFNNHGIKQPFAQVWEPVVRESAIRPTMYQDIELPLYQFKGKEKHGISFSYDYSLSILQISFAGCDLELDCSGLDLRHNLDLNGLVKMGGFTFKQYTRQVNHIVALLDQWTIIGRIMRDDASIVAHLDSATLAQVMEYLNLAIDNGKTNVTAELLNYKNERFPDFDPLAEFTLDDL